MKRTFFVLALLGFVLLMGAECGEAAYGFNELEPGVTYRLQPRSMTLQDEFGNRVDTINMVAGEVRTIYVVVDSFYQDGIIENDYRFLLNVGVTYSLNITQFNPNAIVATSTPSETSYRLGDNLRRNMSTIRITALHPGGTEDDRYPIRYASLFWGLTYEFDGGGAQTIDTPPVSVTVVTLDDAGPDFDDGGGTCNAVGLGSLAMLLPMAFIRKRK